MTDVSITTHFPSEGNQNQNKIRTALQIISMINLGAYSVNLDYNKSMPFLFYMKQEQKYDGCHCYIFLSEGKLKTK